jgi:hypothetical protein
MHKVMNFFNKVFFYTLLITGVVLLFIETERISTMLVAFASFFSSIILAWILKMKNIDDKYMFWINLSLCANLLGEIVIYYSGIEFYDKMLHFLLGILLTAIIFDYFKDNSHLNRDAVFLAVLGCLGLWEIAEYVSDVFFGVQFQGVLSGNSFIMSRIDDTMQDLIWGSIGSWGYLFFRKERLGYAIKSGVEKVKKVEKKERLKFSSFIRNVFGI